MADLPIIGRKEIAINVAVLCTACFPKPKPAILVHKGESTCAECFKAIREKERVVADGT